MHMIAHVDGWNQPNVTPFRILVENKNAPLREQQNTVIRQFKRVAFLWLLFGWNIVSDSTKTMSLQLVRHVSMDHAYIPHPCCRAFSLCRAAGLSVSADFTHSPWAPFLPLPFGELAPFCSFNLRHELHKCFVFICSCTCMFELQQESIKICPAGPVLAGLKLDCLSRSRHRYPNPPPTPSKNPSTSCAPGSQRFEAKIWARFPSIWKFKEKISEKKIDMISWMMNYQCLAMRCASAHILWYPYTLGFVFVLFTERDNAQSRRTGYHMHSSIEQYTWISLGSSHEQLHAEGLCEILEKWNAHELIVQWLSVLRIVPSYTFDEFGCISIMFVFFVWQARSSHVCVLWRLRGRTCIMSLCTPRKTLIQRFRTIDDESAVIWGVLAPLQPKHSQTLALDRSRTRFGTD